MLPVPRVSIPFPLPILAPTVGVNLSLSSSIPQPEMATSTCCLANPIAVTSSSQVFRRSRPRFVRWIRANPPPIPKAALVNRKLVSREVLVRASGPGMEKEVTRTFSFLDARDGEELLSTIKNGLKMGRLPPNVALAMEELYWSYRDAVFQSGIPNAEDIVLSNMSMLLERILLDIQDPFTFLSYHKAIREPYDYYMLGQRYIRPLIDFRRSYVGNIWIFQEIEDELRKGHNVVLVSNHQTEADPAVIALLIERRYPHIAEEMTFVAGDRVITDPLSKPFSMGRNLLCVYSKKHLYDVPELAEMKKKSNTRSLKEMALLLRAGGQIIWIAPSGGRDRPDHMTGECFPATFDAASISNIRRLADHSGVPVHLYPLALLCYDMMPPPAQVEKEIGERRDVSFHGVGLSIGHQVHYDDVVSQLESFKEIKSAFSQVLYNSVNKQYGVLKSAIYDHQGLKASTSAVSLSQPW